MKISVITPAFNAATHIHAAVASVQAQSYQHWEMIIINDGSTDETAAILAAQDDPRILVIHQPKGRQELIRATSAYYRNHFGVWG